MWTVSACVRLARYFRDVSEAVDVRSVMGVWAFDGV